MSHSRRLLEALLETLTTTDEPLPLRYTAHAEQDEEREFACRHAFSALDYAVRVDRRFHPLTWKAVKGTVFEPAYRRAIKVPEHA